MAELIKDTDRILEHGHEQTLNLNESTTLKLEIKMLDKSSKKTS